MDFIKECEPLVLTHPVGPVPARGLPTAQAGERKESNRQIPAHCSCRSSGTARPVKGGVINCSEYACFLHHSLFARPQEVLTWA